jgi:ABC-2 type transport system permease protein
MTTWPLRIAFARLRPFNASSIARTLIVCAVVAGFLWIDYALFARVYVALARVEAETPFFALGILRNLLSLIFMVASVILFSSAMTAAIGAFFTDLDLDVYHTAPRSKLRVAIARWLKTLAQASAVVFLFLVPLIVSFARHYDRPMLFEVVILLNLALLLTMPVSLASVVILLLVRWFPVRRVNQIVATIAVIVLSVTVVAFRMSRPERLFNEIRSGNAAEVLRSIELPAMSALPSSSIAELMTRPEAPVLAPRILILAGVLFAAFLLVAHRYYFAAFVRARESMAPVAIGAAPATRLLDRLVARADQPLRAMLAKEVRTVSRDAAQWSQVFLMAALLFIYLYNLRMLPLGGDARAAIVAYANFGMAGFVIAAICLRFAYPSVSAEGKAFWLVQTAPISYRHFLWVKVIVYAAPLTLLALLLTAFANVLLAANAVVWTFTMIGASVLAVTLVSLGVGMGALSPQFKTENPLQVGLSLGGFAYMGVAMAYVATMMILLGRPLMRFLLHDVLGMAGARGWAGVVLPIVIALTLSAALTVIPMRAAEYRLTRAAESD